MKERLSWLFLLFLAFGLTDCEERAAPAQISKQEKLSILTTVYPLAAIARQVGGERVTVEWIAESGQPAPGENLSDELRSRARSVDFVLSDGESWASEGHDDTFRAQRIIRLDVLKSAASSSAAQGLKWLDPAVAREVAEELDKRLSARRPRLEPEFHSRTQQFLKELDDVTRQYGPALTTDPPRKVLVLSADWMRLLARFGIVPLMPVEANPSLLTAPHIRRLVQSARENALTAILVHADTPPSVIRDLQDKTDLTVLTLDALGSSAGGDRDSYVEILRHNLDQLNQAASRPEP